MATHDFLHIARVEGDRPFTGASLPSAKELHALSLRCGAARDSLRLCHLTPEQTATLGDASTLEEVRLNQRLVRLCARFPQLLQGLQRAPTLLQDAFDTEQGLRQVGGMYAQVRGAARACPHSGCGASTPANLNSGESTNRISIEGSHIFWTSASNSIVRGTTSTKIVGMVRAAGATEVHMRIASPPTTHSCFYGVDTPERSKLLAANHSV